MTDTKLLFKDQKINSSSKAGAKPTQHNLLLIKSAILSTANCASRVRNSFLRNGLTIFSFIISTGYH